MSLAQLFRQGVSRYGLLGGLRRVARVLRRQIRDLPRIHEVHVWYALALTRSRPHIPIPAGFHCRRGTAADLPQLQGLGAAGFLEAQWRLTEGTELWLICRHAEVAGAFWIFHRRTPVRAARGGWLELPTDTVSLEDAIVATKYRGLGLAPASWAQVMDVQAQAGVRVVLAKVAEDNLRSRRAFERVGFQAMARMNFERVWFHPRVRLVPHGSFRPLVFLIRQLNRGG